MLTHTPKRNSPEHRAKMADKAARSHDAFCTYNPGYPPFAAYVKLRDGGSAFINRRTGKPHEHKREIARRLRHSA